MGGRRLVARIVASVFVATLVLSACKASVPPDVTHVDRVCNALCQRDVECSPGWDVDACQRNCRKDAKRFRPYWRDDYVGAILSCLHTSSCDVILQDANRRCLRDTRPEPSPTALRACQIATSKDHLCTGRPVDVDECLHKWNWMTLKDPVLEEIIECEGFPCGKSRRLACIQETLGIED